MVVWTAPCPASTVHGKELAQCAHQGSKLLPWHQCWKPNHVYKKQAVMDPVRVAWKVWRTWTHMVQVASTCPQEPCPERLAQGGQPTYWTLLRFHRLYIQHPSMWGKKWPGCCLSQVQAPSVLIFLLGGKFHWGDKRGFTLLYTVGLPLFGCLWSYKCQSVNTWLWVQQLGSSFAQESWGWVCDSKFRLDLVNGTEQL